MARPHVLITGFGPFPGAAENSSAWLVESLAAARPASRLGYTLHAEVLPTEWAEVATLGPGLLHQHRPRLILHLGLSKRARGFRVERFAHNVIDLREDARGAMPRTRSVLDRGHARLDTRLPATRLAKHLRMHDIPATASRSAGTYLCNYLYYLSLEWARRQESSDVCFVHIPPGPRQGGPLSEAELLRGVDLILRYLLAFVRERDEAVDGKMGADLRLTEPMSR
jgi:pyroglutamyl-peptidase